MNKQAEKVNTNKEGSTSDTGSETDKDRIVGDNRPNSPVPEAGSRAESSDKEALNGVSPKSPQITGEGKGRQTTKESAAKAASDGHKGASGTADRSGPASTVDRDMENPGKARAAE